MRLFAAGIRKLIRRPASWVVFGVLAGLMVLIFVAVGSGARSLSNRPEGPAALLLVTFPQAYDAVIAFIVGLGGLLAVIYGAAVAGSEWGWGTLKNAVARGESRAGYALATFASVVVMLALGLVLAIVIGVIGAYVGALTAGVSTSGIGDSTAVAALPEKTVRAWFAIVEEGALGFAIATLARSQLAGIGAGIAVYFAESFSAVFFPDIVKYLPFNAAQAVLHVVSGPAIGGNGGAAAAARLAPDVAVIVVAAWLVGSLAVSALFTQRAEIAG